ncbi:MAG TPA: efflux RND transporter periplasmic adaptor subunit [Thermodesulfovibrionales bacterium]|nr:efflux RND transporter periplasmic adaptor subunit [Thermodesulfovibrionales bacterium]
MELGRIKPLAAIVLIVAVAALGWIVFRQSGGQDSHEGGGKSQPAPVKVAKIEIEPIELRRTFSGALEAQAKFIVAPKVSGRVKRMTVDLADTVRRGQVVAELDNDEYVQAVAQAKADLEVAKAKLAEAISAFEIANRDRERAETLRKRGVVSESQLDTVKANRLAKQAQLEVAEAQVTRAESSLETAKIRLGYTKITADWTSGNSTRVVAERYVDQGETVSANTPLLLIVELNPITGVIFVTEKDYTGMKSGQSVLLTTDAFPGKEFIGEIVRIAPIFRQSTRQARVELKIKNPEQLLKPGMFIRATVVIDRVVEAIVVPEQALSTRDDRTGVFVLKEDKQTVIWREVKVGIRDGERVQVEGEGLSGWVVTLGQQLVDDGSRVAISSEPGDIAVPSQ